MITLRYWVVDAFTTATFKGNPAPVVLLDTGSSLSETTMQKIAAEFNLAETAFMTPINIVTGRFGWRWFAPKREVPMCGHGTLASAFVLLFHDNIVPKGLKSIDFETVYSGVLTVRALPDGRIELDSPAGEATAVEDDMAQKIKLTVQHAFPGNAQPTISFVGTGNGASYGYYVLIEVNEGYDLENVLVDSDPFKGLAPHHAVIIVTQWSRRVDETFRSRVFCPLVGIAEDAVTGSAHSVLGPYWAKRLQAEDEVEMVGKQVSVRSGEIGVVVDRRSGRCKLRGSVALMAKGEIYAAS